MQSQGLLFLGEEPGAGGDGQPSVVIRSMWDSVVSWMKIAVDFIAADNPPEADPVDTPSQVTKAKVCCCVCSVAAHVFIFPWELQVFLKVYV